MALHTINFTNGKPDLLERETRFDDGAMIVIFDGIIVFIRGEFKFTGDFIGSNIQLSRGSIDFNNIKFAHSVNLDNGKIMNANDIFRLDIRGSKDSIISNSSIQTLKTDIDIFNRYKVILEGNVSVEEIITEKTMLNNIIEFNGTLNIKNFEGVDFNKITGDGIIYSDNNDFYIYKNKEKIMHIVNNEIILDKIMDANNEFYNFHNETLILHADKNYKLENTQNIKNIINNGNINEIKLNESVQNITNNGNIDKIALNKSKMESITNNGNIEKFEVDNPNFLSIKGNGSIKDLIIHNARFSISNEQDISKTKIFIDNNSTLFLFKNVDFANISGGGRVIINGEIYDTSANPINAANINEYGNKITNAMENYKEKNLYIKDENNQNDEIELLVNDEVNSDIFL